MDEVDRILGDNIQALCSVVVGELAADTRLLSGVTGEFIGVIMVGVLGGHRKSPGDPVVDLDVSEADGGVMTTERVVVLLALVSIIVELECGYV